MTAGTTVPDAPFLLALGGAHVDRRGVMAAPFVPGASIPGRMAQEIGGAAFNVLANAARFGLRTALVSARGGDGGGEMVAAALAARGIGDLASVYLDRQTPSYTALVTATGDIAAALADMELYEIALPKEARRTKFRTAMQSADALLVDTNGSETALRNAVGAASGKPVHAMAISPAKAPRLRAVLPGLAWTFMNRREAAAIAGDATLETATGSDLAAGLRAAGIASAVVTGGTDDVVAFTAGRTWLQPVARVALQRDATGAGDALAGIMIAGLMTGLAPETALKQACAAAARTVTAPTAVAEWTPQEIAAEAGKLPPPVPLG